MGIESFTQLDWFGFFRSASPLLAIAATAALVLIMAAFFKEDESCLSGKVAIAGLAAAFWLAWRAWPGAGGAPVLMMSFDRVAAIGWMIAIAAAIAAAMLSIPYLKERGEPQPDYFSLILLATFGMGVLMAAADLITILLGLEIMSLAAYALTGYLKDRPVSVEGALKYFLMGAFATAFFVMGIAFILGSAGTTDLALLASRSKEIAVGEGRSFFLFGCAMAAVGFGFKVAAVPFHAWAPDAYDGAPTPVTSFMATGVKAAAFIAFLRFVIAAASSAGVLWHHLSWALAAATMILGNLAAIRQDNLKRMLAYSSIAHAGYLLVLFPTISANPSAAMRALVLYLIAYVVMTSGAFAAVVAMGLAPGEPVEIGNLAGLSRRRPVLAAAFSLFLISLAGFPPTLGFFGKYYLFLTAVKSGGVPLVVLAALASVVSVYYYLRPVVVMYFRDSEKGREMPQHALSPAVVAVIAVAAMAVILFGILPQNIVALAQGSVF
ncbi:MAG: NADH-quinone oxidoreductase subunit N [Pseudomonadota bacterium]